MQAITNATVVRRFSSRTDFYSYQVLQRETRVFGLLVWRATMDREEIPRHALIEIATLGGALIWRSKFAEHLR
jgi:hypothetical protein